MKVVIPLTLLMVAIVVASLWKGDTGASDLGGLPPKEAPLFSADIQKLMDEGEWGMLIERVSGLEKASDAETMAMAKAHWRLGNLDLSLKLAEELMEKGAQHPFIREVRVRSLLDKKMIDAAQSHLDPWLKVDAKNGNAFFASGLCAWQKKDFEKAVTELKTALKLGCEEQDKATALLRDFLWKLGVDERKKGAHAKAVKFMEESVALKPSDAKYYLKLAQEYVKVKRFDDALKTLHVGLTKEMTDDKLNTALYDEIVLIHHGRAQNALLNNNYATAVLDGQRALEHAKAQKQKYNLKKFVQHATELYVKDLREEGRAKNTKEVWKTLLVFKPKDPEARWELARSEPALVRETLRDNLLMSHWKTELCRRLALEEAENNNLLQACHWMIRHHTNISGRMRLNAELKLVAWLKVLPEYKSPLLSPQWKEVWRLFHTQVKSVQWNDLMQKVTEYFPDRYFLMIYEAEQRLLRGEKEKFLQLAKEIETLDPPKSSREKLKALRSRSDLLK